MSGRTRVVFLSGSRWSSLGGEIARALPAERYELHAVCERVTLSRVRGLTTGSVIRKVGEIVASRVARLLGRGTTASGPPALCDVSGVTLHDVGRIGDDASVALLTRLAPSLSINTGGCGILRANLLSAAGPVLNVHCGLPYTRGFNAVEWTAWFGLPFRICVHEIEPGVDTGRVLLDATFARPDGLRVDALRRAFDDRFGALFVEAVERLVREGDDAFVPQDLARGRTFYAMHRDLRDVLDGALAAGRSPAEWLETIDAPSCRDVAVAVL